MVVSLGVPIIRVFTVVGILERETLSNKYGR